MDKDYWVRAGKAYRLANYYDYLWKAMLVGAGVAEKLGSSGGLGLILSGLSAFGAKVNFNKAKRLVYLAKKLDEPMPDDFVLNSAFSPLPDYLEVEDFKKYYFDKLDDLESEVEGGD